MEPSKLPPAERATPPGPSICRTSASPGRVRPRVITYTDGNADPFDITITFSAPVTGLTADDFQIAGATIGTPEAQSPSGGYATVWKAAVTPARPGGISVLLPAGAVSVSSGQTNTKSNGWAIVTTAGGL